MTCWRMNGLTIVPKVAGSTPTPGSVINGITGHAAVNGQTIDLDTEVDTWIAAIVAFSAPSQPGTKTVWVAQGLIMAIRAASYGSKIKWLLPMLGGSGSVACFPLRDSLARGACSGVTGTFSEATGMKGNGTTVALDSKYKPSEVGSSNNGGVGFWENDVDLTGSSTSQMMGTVATGGNRYGLQQFSTVTGYHSWGATANTVYSPDAGASNGHYYGQSSAQTSRKIFFQGVLKATDTTNDTRVNANERNIYIIGENGSSPVCWKGRCAAAYFTDGTLADADVADFHTLLITHLFTPTGRPTS